MTAKQSPVTIHDVARVAGVAAGSVSRALNNRGNVSAKMREHVLTVAKQLNYSRLRIRRGKPHPATPVSSGEFNLGLICFGMEDTLVNLPVVSTALHGIETAVGLEGGTLMFANIPRGDRVPAFLTDHKISGLIIKGPNQGVLPERSENELIDYIYRYPHVWLMGRLPNAVGDHCNFDQEKAGQLAVEHLHQKGHRHIAFLNPKPGHTQFEYVKRAVVDFGQRMGVKVDVFEPGLSAPPAWPLPAISSPTVVDSLVQRWAGELLKNRATSFVVGADSTAVQVYRCLARLGIKVGSDVGLVSCNDERSLVSDLDPPLTTVDVRAEIIGRNAVGRLKWRLAHRDDSTPCKILVEPVLIERDSVPMLAYPSRAV
jgi:DNA-binding LacI/PurR family transcriptional regulator